MRIDRIRQWLLVLATSSLCLAAQAWPDKPVRIVISFPPGAPGDIVARAIQPALQQELGQPVVVDNRPGAGGNIGAQEVARATDQHTFLVGPDTMLTINPHLYRKMAFDPLQDLVPVTLLVGFNQMLVCNPAAHVKTLADLVQKAKSGSMNYASGGPGVPGHMAMEMLLASEHMKMTHVPYKGPAPAMQDVIAGQVPCGFLAAPAVGPHVKAGRLVAIGVSGLQRSPGSPAVPTLAELGVKDFDASFYEIMAAPKNTPPAIVQRMHDAVVKALNLPAIRSRLLADDLEPVGDPSADARLKLEAANRRWGAVARRIGLVLD